MNSWFRDQLVLALAIMDEKGKVTDTSVWLWAHDWGRLRSTLLECVNRVDARTHLRAVNAELVEACEESCELLKWAVNLYSQAGDVGNSREEYHQKAREARDIVMNQVLPKLEQAALARAKEER